ncbi:GAF domain-containing protein [Ramlibacter sp. XY19]|uniref:ATP-binding protein n=1 Tax=Ramlibacter paludis TaxID=2908000 RepID=UPI0023D9B1BE|nr:ATP-binding protein [Ramlibacter paludis]MCG2592259.1 GAF domain-containing protein [Ramlibacter paludis]
MNPQAEVTLDNCDREPIHIPGATQDHGALLAFTDDGRLAWASGNAAEFLGARLPELGAPVDPAMLDGQLREALASLAEGMAGISYQHEVKRGDATFDLIAHHNGTLRIAEFERRERHDLDLGAFAIMAHRSLGLLRQQRGLQGLLEVAVQELRALTGFDRVMAYRFRHDASGDVVAESRRDDLEPFLNRRYPAGDIPAQARRLYVVNTLRLIADVGSRPVPLAGVGGQGPLDMSYCALRSVSPIHIEYLSNMGVAASMSVSIVVGGQLWGMLACHHMEPRQVPYAVRMACDVLAQLLANNVQSLLASEHAQHMAVATSLRARVIEQTLHAEDALQALGPFAGELATTFGAQGVVIAENGHTVAEGATPAQAQALVKWLDGLEPSGMREGLWSTTTLTGLPADLAACLSHWCGILALRIDDLGGGWLVLLRREQIETIAWGGRPEKNYVNGPLGPRLTPRGSFDVWKETVRGMAVPWTRSELEMAGALRDELARAANVRHAELGRARNQMLAVLGHDLRNPLQTIAMAAHVLERGEDSAKLGQRITRSSTRMERLISQVLDMSRLQSGLGLGVKRQPVDMVHLVEEAVQEATMAHPGTRFELQLPQALVVQADGDRLMQLMDNLVGNARQHGAPDAPLVIRLRREGNKAIVQVANTAAPIPPDVAGTLFTPYKRSSLGNERNRGGLGLGLHIAREIALAHGGSLSYAYEDPLVVFTLELPGAVLG